MHFHKAVLVSFFFASILLATPSWESLGGSFQGSPFLVQGANGLEAFVRGTDNALWFAAQTSPGGSWTPFASLGGFIISNPAAAVDPNGRIAVFAVGGDTAVWRRVQVTAGVDTYSDWTSIGGSSASDLAVVQANPLHGIPTAYLFVRGPDGALWANFSNYVTGPWGASWTNLGGYLTSAPTAGLNANDEATVFVRGGDNTLWYRQGSTATFNDWATLGGAMNGPASVAEVNGYVMYWGLDNAAWFIRDTTAFVRDGDAPTTWSDRVSLGGYIVSNPTMPSGVPEVFVVGGDNALWVTASTGGGSAFGPWQSLGGSLVGDPSAMLNHSDNTLDVFAIGFDGALWHIRQSTAGTWE